MKTTPKDHTKLICEIGELTGLFTDATSLEAFLEKIVVMISEHMQSDICSIYIYYEDRNELVLTATKGLHPDSVGKVRMKLGEGLTGLALKELRPICEQNASHNSHFKYFPGIGEEKYESFLAVPIMRGNTRIGAMVIQNTKKGYFVDDDIKVLRAITSQLANTIEMARLLITFQKAQGQKTESVLPKSLKFIKGKVGSEGYAYAEAVVIDHERGALEKLAEDQRVFSIEDFQRAVKLTEEELGGLQKQIEEKLLDVASLIFTAQILMLKDKGFIDAIVDLVRQGVNPPQAVLAIVKKYIVIFEQIPNAYMREKSHDVEDIGRRLLSNLTGKKEDGSDYANRIIIARELFPSDILKLSSQGVKGAILLSGGASSHLSILARSLQIPLIIADRAELLRLPVRTKIILDAEVGNIYINPSEEVLKPFKDRESLKNAASKAKKTLPPETKTKDGTRIKLLSNINLFSDIKFACELHSEGVGLYRTEFPFIVRTDFPSEEEQFVIYKRIIEGMPGKEMTFRTLDIGGDKVLSYYEFEKEENPFLGMRSIRFSLRHKDIFSQQIRAILRAGVGADIKIMFPMISSLDEFLEAKEVVLSCLRDLKKEKIPHNDSVPVGLMIELPSVLEIMEDLSRAADFFSIGTNDFIQYMLAVDRTNEKVADFYLAHHPSILRALGKIVDIARSNKKEISICGDMAHDEKYLPYFLGIGIRRISLDARHLAKLRAAILNIDLGEARRETELLLKQNRISDTARIVEENR